MKFGNHILRRADKTDIGDVICFEMDTANYIIRSIEHTKIGMIRHQHDGGSNSYWPHELLFVLDPIETNYGDRNIVGFG